MNASSQTGNGTSSRMSKSRSVQCNKGTGRVKAAKNQKTKTKISKTNSYKNLKQKLSSISEVEVTENKEHPKNFTKKPLTIATWNVTSLVSNTSKNYQLATSFDNYGIDLLGVTETHMPGSGEIVLDNGAVLVYSGTSGKKEHGVGLMISSKLRCAFISYTPFNDRILTARMHSKQVNITIIVAYAPPEYAETKLKDGFYNGLIAVHNDIPQNDVRILTGDFNARVSSDSSRWQGTVGKQSLHDSANDNGQRFMDFCALHEYIIGGTLFEHKDIHKATWLSPKGDFTSQIDHICINNRWKKCLLDVRSQRGADINTSHYLVRGKLRLKLSSLKKSKNISPPNLDALRSGEKVAEY